MLDDQNHLFSHGAICCCFTTSYNYYLHHSSTKTFTVNWKFSLILIQMSGVGVEGDSPILWHIRSGNPISLPCPRSFHNCSGFFFCCSVVMLATTTGTSRNYSSGFLQTNLSEIAPSGPVHPLFPPSSL